MKQGWLVGIITGTAVAVAALAFSTSLWAQGGAAPAATRVAVVDVVHVFNEYQRQKDLTEEIKTLQNQLEEENKQRRNRIDAAEAELGKLNQDDPTFVGRTRELLAMQIDYKNWVDLKQADLAREIALWSTKIYREIQKACGEVGEREGWDLVLYRGEFEPASREPDAIKEQIRSTQVLYSNNAINLTQKVLDQMNATYRSQPHQKMMYVP